MHGEEALFLYQFWPEGNKALRYQDVNLIKTKRYTENKKDTWMNNVIHDL